jgi:ribosomal protein S8
MNQPSHLATLSSRSLRGYVTGAANPSLKGVAFRSVRCADEGGLKLTVPNAASLKGTISAKRNRSNDLMADALSRIRNAYFRSFQDVIVVDSKEIRELLNALIHAGYLNNWCCANATEPAAKPRQGTVEGGSIKVSLKYFQNMPAMRGMQQISSPGKRTYMNMKRILKYSEEQN